MSKLVIVESPAKAKTIGRYLGENYKVKASVGHIRDLPSSTLGVDVKNKFKALYVNMKGKEKVIKELKEAAKMVGEILIATDPDREGEAIAWHLANILKIDPSSKCRITFNEITAKAVKEAIENPKSIDLDLVNAQQARRILDRLVGFELSPLMWKKIKKGLSAGRVQSVATRMIVDREEEINSFVPEEYWYLDLSLAIDDDLNNLIKTRYFGILNGDKIKRVSLNSKDDVDYVKNEIKKGDFSLYSCEKKEKKRKAPAPFTTSSMQQEAARRLSFTAQRTMRTAQQLYEGLDLGQFGTNALLTYIRTDSVRVSKEAQEEARNWILNNYGEKYLPSKPNFFKNKNASQDAHEAIRPAHFEFPPLKIKEFLTSDQFRLYKLIWERFMASQMREAIFEANRIDIVNNCQIFRVTGEVAIFRGHLIFQDKKEEQTGEDENNDKEELFLSNLPPITKESTFGLHKIEDLQKFTKPPARYNESSLIKALEEKGIGRPSTYAPTITTILTREYVVKEGKQLMPTQLGITVTSLLKKHFAEIVNLKFTANMEEKLDEVESGQMSWVLVLEDFYPKFHELVEKANDNLENYKLPEKELDEACPICQSKLVIKDGRFGEFVACSSFPECKYTRNIVHNIDVPCPLCGANIQSKKSKKGAVFYVCSKEGEDKDCKFISWNLPIKDKKCPVCSAYMVKKKFRNRSFEICSNDECPSKVKKKDDKKKEDKNEN